MIKIMPLIVANFAILVNAVPSDDTTTRTNSKVPLPTSPVTTEENGGGLYSFVYVDAKKGVNHPSCGKSRSSSCKSLYFGLKQVKHSGVIYLMGNHTLEGQLDLYKDVYITGVEGANIIGCRKDGRIKNKRFTRSNKGRKAKNQGKRKWAGKGNGKTSNRNKGRKSWVKNGKTNSEKKAKQSSNNKGKKEGNKKRLKNKEITRDARVEAITGTTDISKQSPRDKKSSAIKPMNIKSEKGMKERTRKQKGAGHNKKNRKGGSKRKSKKERPKESGSKGTRCDFAFQAKKAGITVRLSNIRFINIGVISMRTDSAVSLLNVSVEDSTNSLFRVPLQLKNEFTIDIENSTFLNTGPIVVIPGKIRGLFFKYGYGDKSKVTISHSLFNNTGGIQLTYVKNVMVTHSTFVDHILRDESVLHLEKCGTFSVTHSRFQNATAKARARGGFIRVDNSQSVTIRQCSFYSGAVNGPKAHGGAIYFAVIRKAIIVDSAFKKCLAKLGGAVAVFNIYTSVVFRRCKFEENKSKFGGAVYASVQLFYRRQESKGKEGRLRIKFLLFDSYFINNEAATIGQAIYSNDKSKLSKIEVIGNSTSQTTHVHLEGERVQLEELKVQTNTQKRVKSGLLRNLIRCSSPDIQWFGRMNFVCPRHLNPQAEHMIYNGPRSDRFKNENIRTLLMVQCVACPVNQYTLVKGKYRIHKKGKKTWRKITQGACIACPNGAVCDGDVKPIDNYWGYMISDAEVKFIKCPSGFCCSSQTTPCATYDTCALGRTGTLCSFCADGYSQSFVSEECVLKSGIQCNLNIFIVFFISASLLYTIIFTFTPCIITAIKKLTLLFKNRGKSEDTQENDEILEDKEEERDTSGDSENITPLPMSAVVTMIFLFFQIASLVNVKTQRQSDSSSTRKSQTERDSLKALFDFFNFRFSVNQELCPMDDLTLPTKEFINIGLKLCSIFYLLLFFLGWRLLSLIKSCRAPPTCSNSKNQDGNFKGNNTKKTGFDQDELTFPSILKIGFIKLVKLNFTSISTFSFRMVHCVTIGNISYLFLYTGYQCYTWWQMIILFAILPIVVLFPLSFGMGLNLLKEGTISTTGFLVASVLPVYPVFLYMKKRLSGMRRQDGRFGDEMCKKQILEMEEELFREQPDTWMRWPVVQLYRNLLIVIMDTFILNPIYKSISFIPVFLFFVVHDRHRRPYKHPYLNCLQVLSSCCLVIVNGCNIPASFSSMTNLMGIPMMSEVISVMKVIELGMFVVMPLSLIVWRVWEKYEAYIKQKNDRCENRKED